MVTDATELKHATFVKVGQLGVLILGDSGAGKSALALALMDQSGCGTGKVDLQTTLISDDQVVLWCDEVSGRLHGKPPEAIAGLLEIRGIGIVKLEHVPFHTVDLVVEIVQAEEIERMPEFPRATLILLGQAIPFIDIAMNDPAVLAKVRAAVSVLLGRIIAKPL